MSVIKSNQSGLGGSGDVGGALGSFYGHTIDQSLRFNDDDSAYLSRTPSSASNRRTFTFSAWIKVNPRATNYPPIFSADNSTPDFVIRLSNTGTLQVVVENGGGGNSLLITNRLFRDPSSWYHIVVAIDTTNSTADDRIKIYVNGVQETSFASRTNPSLNFETKVNNTVLHRLGLQRYGSYWDGYMAEVNFLDGLAYDASYFGETKDGVWIPKEYSGSYGTNGFYLPFSHDTVSEGFTPVLYEGTRVADTIVKGTGFTPDLVWAKRRDGVQEGRITDSVRGVNAQLRPAATNIETTFSNAVTSFDPDGFTLGVDTSSGTQSFNYYQDSHVAWCWEAGGAPTATNSAGAGATPTAGSVKIDGSNLGSALAGTIPATKLTANTAKGFSIVSYTGTGSNGTIAHGLSSAPEMIIIKARTRAEAWLVYHKFDGGTDGRSFLNLDVANAKFDNGPGSYFQDTPPTSSVFYQNTSSYNQNTDTYIAYCWHSVSGYSKFGSYTGSGSSGKAVTGLGFRPVFVMVKRTDSSGGWHVFDSVRFPSNPIDKRLEWDNAEAENSDATVDIQFDSDGFTLLTSFDNMNASSGTYIFMAFADTRDSAFYKDNSGNLNTFTPNNVFTHDVVPDSPTNNFATMNPIYHSALEATLLDGNLKVDTAGFNSNANNYGAVSTFAIPKDKKIYLEVECTDANGNNWYAGFATQSGLQAGTSSTNVGGISAVTLYGRAVMKNGTQFQYSSSSGLGGLGGGTNPLQAGDILGMAVDGSNGNVWFHKNGSYFKTIASNNGSTGNVGDPSANSDPVATINNVPEEDLFVVIGGNTSASAIFVNFGQDGQNVASANSDSEGIGTFEYAVPTDYVCLCAANLTTPAIGPTKGTQADDHFDTVLYTGNGNSSKRTDITFASLIPDWVWIKQRSSTQDHALHDTVRGSNKKLESNNADAEVSGSGFGTDGLGGASNNGTTELRIFTADAQYNASSATYVAWGWKAGGSASSNSNGSITSSVSANQDAGFSIVSWTGTGSAGTIGHGLSSAPEHIIVKNRDSTAGRIWLNYVKAAASDAETDYLSLSGTGSAVDNADIWNDTAPTSTVFSVGSNASANESSDEMIAYCFHSVEGYSDFGSYVGNNSTDGPFVFTGFRPAFLILKRKDNAASWLIYDNKRDTYNQMQYAIFPDLSNAEYTSNLLHVDFLSNGFKVRNATYGETNASGGTYIYLAFAEAPFKFANAR